MLNQISNPLLPLYVSNSPLLPLMVWLLLFLFLFLFLAPLLLLSFAPLSPLLVHADLITRPVFLRVTGAEYVEYVGWGLCPTKIKGVGGAQAPPYILFVDFVWVLADFIWPCIYGGMYLTPLPLLISLTFTLTVILNPSVTVNPPDTVNRFVIANSFIVPSESWNFALQNFKPLYFVPCDKGQW